MPRSPLSIQTTDVINFLADEFMDGERADFHYPRVSAIINVPDGRYEGGFYYPDQGFGRGQKNAGDGSSAAAYASYRIGPAGRHPLDFTLANGTFAINEHGVSATVKMSEEASYRETFGSNASLVQMVSNHLKLSAFTAIEAAVMDALNTAGNWANSNTPGTLWNAGTPGNMMSDINASVGRLRPALGRKGSKSRLWFVAGELVLEDLQAVSQFQDQINATAQSLVEAQGDRTLTEMAMGKWLGFENRAVFVDTTEDSSRVGADESFNDILGRGALVAYLRPGEYTAESAPWDSALLLIQNKEPTVEIEQFGVGNLARWELSCDFNFDVVTRSVAGDHWANPTS